MKKLKLNKQQKLNTLQRQSRSILIALCIATLVSMMMVGCNSTSSLNQFNQPKQIPSNLSQPCPDLQLLDANTGKAWLPWSVDTVKKYNDCKFRHDALIKAVTLSSLSLFSFTTQKV